MDISINQLSIEQLSGEDYQHLIQAMKAAYPAWQGSFWSMEAITRLISEFNEGQFVVKANDKLVGCALSIIVDYSKLSYSKH